MRIQRLGGADWQLLRDTRLAALTDAPYAFGSTRAAEELFDEATWRSRAASFAWFIALDEKAATGLAGGASLDRPQARILFSLWADQRVRGSGVAEGLVDAVGDWARGEGAQELILWNADGNDRAQRFYQRLGFVGTGNRKQMARDPAVGEAELRLPLHPGLVRPSGGVGR